MKQSMRQRQQGMTFIGLLCILALVGVIGYAGIRLAPLYLNYMKIARTMETAATEVKGDNPGSRRTCAAHWSGIGRSRTLTAVDYKDIEITKDDSGVSMHVAYDDSVPYIANVSLSVHFDKTVKVQ